MYDNHVYADGVWGVLKVRWELKCATPLAIRNGKTIHYTVDQGKASNSKDRGLGLTFHWAKASKESGEKEPEIAALHYGYEVTDDGVQAYHFVPASSVRGALRSWTIGRVVDPSYRQGLTPPKRDNVEKTQKYVNRVNAALTDKRLGYQLVGSLFGLAAASGYEKVMPENAGRLRVRTERFGGDKLQPIQANGRDLTTDGGPDNVRREMVVRNPLDRISHESKEGGLHQFLQICKGETFIVHLEIANPTNADLGLLWLWWREIDYGILRLGALTGIGRGRLSMYDDDYCLWLRRGMQEKLDLSHFSSVASSPDDDVLAGLWEAYRLSNLDLYRYESLLCEELEGSRD